MALTGLLELAKYAIKVAKMANADIFFMHAVVNPPHGDPRSGGMMISAYTSRRQQSLRNCGT